MLKITPLEELVLMTLSFFEPMTLSKIILDFDSKRLIEFPDFDKEQLQTIIIELENKKLIARVTIDKEIGWIRIQRKRSWIQKLLAYLDG